MQMAPKPHEFPGNQRKLRALFGFLLAAVVLMTAWPTAAVEGSRAPAATAEMAASSAAATLGSAAPAPLTPTAHAGAPLEAQPPPAPGAAATDAAEKPPAAAPPAPAAASSPAAAPVATEPQPPPAPAPATPPDAVPAGALDANRYVVVAGDTVGAIAARFGLDTLSVLAANGLGPYTPIVPGQTLRLSGPAVAVAAGAAVAPEATAPGHAPVPGPAPAAAVAAPAAARTIFVAGSGAQAMVDRCIGPIHFTPTDAYSLFITEHDFCGGWARFSGISVGETVVVSGYGTYTATGRGQVLQGGSTTDVAVVFGGFPRAILQTCIPGTNQMLLIALN